MLIFTYERNDRNTTGYCTIHSWSKLVLIGYSGYTKESRYETDKMVRQEIIRTATRVRNHMENILERQYISGNLEMSRITKLCIEECDYLIEDVKAHRECSMHFSQDRDLPRKEI